MVLVLSDLDRAVRLQRQAYALLVWFQNHLDCALFPTHEAHSAMDNSAVAQQWIEANLLNLPADVAPAHADISSLAALFCSYLTTSFEIVTSPSSRLHTTTGCLCDVCLQLARCSHLQPKRVGPGDKAYAERFKLKMLKDLATEHDILVDEARVRNLLSDQDLREQIALVAYAQQLLLRLDGDPGDPAILVLWREFAWTRHGAPKKGFSLNAQDIVEAQDQLILTLKKASAEMA